MARLAKDIPSDLREIMIQVKQGRIKVGFEHRELENFISEMDRSSNRIFSLYHIIPHHRILHDHNGWDWSPDIRLAPDRCVGLLYRRDVWFVACYFNIKVGKALDY